MPVKLPKAFLRRKSAGNTFETYQYDEPSSESTFRVLTREEVPENSFARERKLNRPIPGRPKSSPDQVWGQISYDEAQTLSNRCGKNCTTLRKAALTPDRTNNSSSTGNTSSSDRYSYQSTKPSSLDSKYEEDVTNTRVQTRGLSEEPDKALLESGRLHQNRQSFSASIGNRTFSIPRPRIGKSGTSPQRKNVETSELGRDRSMTSSSIASSYASTAVPPPKLDLGVALASDSAINGGGWFDDLSGRRTPIMEEPNTFESPLPPLPPQPTARRVLPSQLADRDEANSKQDSDSMLAAKKQFSWEEQVTRAAPLSRQLDKTPAPDQRSRRSWESNESEKAFLSRGSYRNTPDGDRYSSRVSTTIRSPTLEQQQDSPSLSATDDQGLLDAAWASQALDARYGPKSSGQPALPDRSRASPGGFRTRTPTTQTLEYSRHIDPAQSSSASTPRALPTHDEQGTLFETEETSEERTIASNQRASTMLKTNKIMTPAEFEKYKKSAVDESDDGSESHKSDESDAYEDEDETERAKQVARQRRKQEAHLAVYRQQMMKVTGEQPADLPILAERPELPKISRSLPSMSGVSTLDPRVQALNDSSGKTSDDEDDDEIPLGVLQAHGFPSRSRPPTRLTSASTSSIPRPGSQLSAYPAPLGATKNDLNAGGGGNTNLPPFARHFPRDPYVGASLVNQANRESLQQNGHQAGGLPPGGLVGVIAGEERARAMRRGSPNVNGLYGQVTPSQQTSMPALPSLQVPHHGMQPTGMGMPFTPLQQQQMMYGDHNQSDVNSSMLQMMQVQMQWMQQMMQMQGMPMPNMMPGQAQSEAGSQYSPNFLSPLQQSGMRDSIQSTVPTINPRQYQRTSSGMSQHPDAGRAPSLMGNWQQNFGQGSNYAPSIAPSERSNVGQPSRYRPVTSANATSTGAHSRTNTMSLSSANQLNSPRSRSRSPHKLDLPTNTSQGLGAVMNPPPTIRALNKPKKGTGAVSDDEEDDAGWEEMKKRRDERRNRWTARKKAKEAEMGPPTESGGLEGLYYEG